MNERADNHKTLQQLSRMERFALMYGHPLKAMKEEHPKETAYRETEELVELNMELPYHNPQEIESPGDGFFFKLKGSTKEEGDQIWNAETPGWEPSIMNNGTPVSPRHTYRSKIQPQPKQTEEEKFEAWYKIKGWNIACSRCDEASDYDLFKIGWLARAALE